MAKRNVVGNIPALEEELSWLKPSTKSNIKKEAVHAAPVKAKEHSKPAEVQKRSVAVLQKRRIAEIHKPHPAEKPVLAGKSKGKNVHVSFYFPETISRKLKENAVMNDLSLSGYISNELVKNSNKKIDLSTIKNISGVGKKSQLSLMLPENIIKNLKLEAINLKVSYTDLLIAKLK